MRASSATRGWALVFQTPAGVDVEFFNQGLLDHQLTDPHQQHFQGFQVGRRPSAHPLQGLVNFGLLHQPTGQGGV
jgi:hypothetical protein